MRRRTTPAAMRPQSKDAMRHCPTAAMPPRSKDAVRHCTTAAMRHCGTSSVFSCTAPTVDLQREVRELREQVETMRPFASHTLNGMQYGSEASTATSRRSTDLQLRRLLTSKYSRGGAKKKGVLHCMATGAFLPETVAIAAHLYIWLGADLDRAATIWHFESHQPQEDYSIDRTKGPALTHDLPTKAIRFRLGKVKTFGDLDERMLQSAKTADSPVPFSRALHFHVTQAVRNAKKQGWAPPKGKPELQCGAVTPPWADRVQRWQLSIKDIPADEDALQSAASASSSPDDSPHAQATQAIL
ncbi:hypothetical protein JKP88DRAFT_244534 [Tribonema minus]|uniref:Uncharacterized protein n=1 Tax=Tribonema minus TaxID=303371 RepID=A0A835Z3F2_9STRA|nr:hypothetical protein JKP88DRAFT_244534 [Tribonema minus]